MMKTGTWKGLIASKQQPIANDTTISPMDAPMRVIGFSTNSLNGHEYIVTITRMATTASCSESIV